MKIIWLIARNTYREIIRDRILYGLVVFAILLLGLSLALGQLSYAEQSKISVDFGLMGIHLSAVILAIFVGSTLVSRELEKRTIMTLLSHAVTRGQFLVGKFFGMTMVLFVILSALFVIMCLITLEMGGTITSALLIALFGALLESMLVLSMTIMFGVFSSPLMAVSFSLGMFLIGHWIGDLGFFAEKSKSDLFMTFTRIVNYLLPNLERFNWRSNVTYQVDTPFAIYSNATVYGVSWMVIFLLLAIVIFRRRDFV